MDQIPPLEHLVQIVELRGRVGMVEGAQESHEKVCAERYHSILTNAKDVKDEMAKQNKDVKDEMGTQNKELKADIASIRAALGKYFVIVFTILIGLVGWALNSLYAMQQDTNRAILQVNMGQMTPTASAPSEQSRIGKSITH